MRILVLGNQGYVGPVVTQYLYRLGNFEIDGLDTGLFAQCLTTIERFPEYGIRAQFFKDVRDIVADDVAGYDVIVYLAAVSNDPMGKEFVEPTYEINQAAAINVAKLAAKKNVTHFIFASSCSVYGAADGKRSELSPLNPLTAYANSKIGTEKALQDFATETFRVTCLRFATACGWSPRLRLDLVLNDFVASAIATRQIEILSDGTPWRPLIHVEDMARAIAWAIQRNNGNPFLSVNVGSDQWNFQVSDLAETVSKFIKGTKVKVNTDAPPDNRSYQVDFSLYMKLAPKYQPQVSLEEAVIGLIEGLNKLSFNDTSFRDSNLLIRLNTLRMHMKNQQINKNLRWS